MNRRISRHLTHEERCQISVLLKSGKSYRDIGKLLGVHHSTIVRELQRSQQGDRHKKASSVPEKMMAEVIQRVKQLLSEQQASPKKISMILKHETLYRDIRKDQQTGGDLAQHLRLGIKRHHLGSI